MIEKQFIMLCVKSSHSDIPFRSGGNVKPVSGQCAELCHLRNSVD